ncbi:efflux RND transporter periplasmic adaptor subunit [Shewanella submarina]|uniref:Efflux RND transporter periplasmic adaptor subunit n=1 Tax=Shewanella submarina TaxID=2016376 RepID=A0ABV7GEB6_9GAMM|nr:efflux RND transporter periplasmic adaptor subunit [Shewanella submarina]MCL1037477.1 efflux RND transporter periplasmic adaptor subunit [Shewanella submarina]
MKKIIIGVLVLGIGAAGYFYWPKQESKGRSGPRGPVKVVVTEAAMAQVRDEVEALGTLKANESVSITPKVTDVVTEIHFDDGNLVEQGSLLVQLQDVEQQARVKAAKVKLEEQMRELARIRSLVSNKTVAELERDRLQSQLDTARAELEAAQSSLTDRRIAAPFAGRLGLRQVSIGGLVTPGTLITTLDDISVVKLDFTVPERFIAQMKPGKSVEALSTAYPDEVFVGTVSSIDSRVDPATRAVTVRAQIANPELKLLPGMLMQVKLIRDTREALMVPESAIIPISDRHYLYLVVDGKIERRQVTIGSRERGWVEITEGLTPGESVVIRGIMKVRPGSEVTTEQGERFTFKDKTDTERG